jgi:hypothetical protein
MYKLKIGKGHGLLVLLVMNCSLFSCVDPIPFETEVEIPKMVVFGTFTQQSKDHEITINRTGKFGSIGRPVGGAIVEIINDEGERAQYVEGEVGRYILSEGDMCGEPGKTYKLSITYGSLGRFESSWEFMPDPVQIEETRFEVNFRQQVSNANVLFEQLFIDILIDTPTKTPNRGKAYFRWEVDEVWSLLDFSCGPFDKAEICFYKVDEKFNDLKIFASLDDSQEMLMDYRVFYRQPFPHLEFSERHYFNVRQLSISESTYNYWEKINIVTNPTGSIFDKLPAAVPGNIVEVNGDLEVLGYFEVASESVGRVYTDINQLGENIKIIKACNPYYTFYFQPDYCCYCSLLPNQVPRPDWWGE